MESATLAKAKPHRIGELDALRGFAALFVVCFHYGCLGSKIYFLRVGVTGVDLFFIISGFVILLTVEKTDNLRRFAINRFSRLFPVYWVCVTITALGVLLTKPVNISFFWRYLANLTMFQELFKQPDLDGSYWTLIVELFFYLYIAIILLTKQIKNIEEISFMFLVFEFAYALLIPVLGFSVGGIRENKLAFYLPIINHFPLFFAGMLFYKMKTERPTLVRYLGLLLCYICQLLMFNWVGRSSFFVSQALYAGLLAGYFMVFYLFTQGKLKFMVNPVTLFFGSISYVLYLLHQYVGVNIGIPFFSKFMNGAFACLLVLILIVILSAIINRYVEIPAMLFFRRKPINQVPAIKIIQGDMPEEQLIK